MAFCPNKNLRAWIDLEIAQPERSYQLWDEYKGNVPSKYYNVKPLLDKVKKELKFRSPLFTSELILLKSRLKDYNTKNGTSHKLNITKIGESDRHKVDLYLDYTPVNEEMRREREAIRSEEGKSFYNIEETNREDIVNPLIEEARRIQLEDAKRAGIDYDDRYLFNQTIGIKPGVAELFESNPELANAVYEALGFKEKRNSGIEELLVVDENEISKKEGESFAETQKRVIQNINIRKRIEIANKNNIVQGKSYSYYEIKEIFNNDKLFDNEIYKQLSTILQSSNLVFKFGSLNQGKKTKNAYYNSINNSINIDTLVLQTPNLATSDFKRILLHEIIHAATFINLEEGATLTNTQKTALNNLNNLITELNRDKDFFAQYGLTNANELLAELANEQFVDKLKKKTFKGNQSFFDKIISEIVKLLGLNTTAYDIVKESFDNLVKEYKGISQITQQQKRQAQELYSQYLNSTFNNGQDHVEGFKEFVNRSVTTEISFDKELHNKIEEILRKLYPEILLKYSNNPIWLQDNNVFNQKEFTNQVNYRLKATEKVLDNLAKIKQWEANKSINQETLWKKIGELGIPKQQLELLKESEGTTIEEKLTLFVANYSYTVEINTAKTPKVGEKFLDREYGYELDVTEETLQNQIRDGFVDSNLNTQYYSNLTVPGGTNYTENEISTPLITPSIKGHAQFSTDKGIGWFRSDEQVKEGKVYQQEEDDYGPAILQTYDGSPTKTRRILEIQSDLFQKGRDKEQLSENIEVVEYKGKKYEIAGYLYNGDIQLQDPNSKELYEGPIVKSSEIKDLSIQKNQFLQLLNKDNNWVTFFVKSIIQDSAKKGYEKVLFPTGNTASKVEGHATLEEFKKQKEDRIKELEKENKETVNDSKNVIGFYIKNNEYYRVNLIGEDYQVSKETYEEVINEVLEKNNNEITQLKKELERVETEGFGALKPIYNFYENTVTNILKKQYGKEAIKQITDEYGNTWNELTINQSRDLAEVLLQRNEANKIIGQANIKAFTVLIDAINQKQDTLPHEYAHHYIAWFRNAPLVQEAIKKWGSEESLVQAIGEQVVKQKGEAWNWWREFSEWVKNIFNKLSDKSKEELRDILTSAFLQRIDVRTGRTLDIDSIKALVSPEIWNQTNTSKVDNSGSKKKLSNLKDAFETILDKLERRRKILENLGKEKQTKIYNTIIAKLETQYKAEKYLEGINLFLIEGHNMFDSIQKDLKKFYDGKYNANVIRRMGSFASSFKVMLEETSRGLYEERKDATGDRLNKIKELQVRVAELQDIVKNVKEDWLELSRRVTSEFLYAFDQYRTKEELYNILSKPVKDISTPNTWFNSILESNDEMSRLIGKAVSDTRELARLEVLRTQQDFVDLKKELEKGGIKDTSWMYSTYNGNKTEEFVSERDWAYYNNLKSELYKEANKIFEDLDIGYYEYLDMSKGDKAKFINSLSPSKKSQFNTFKTKEKKFYAENTLSEIEVLRLKDEMVNKLSKEDYEIWLKLNVEVRNGKEIVPSKKSVQYIEIQSNPLKKKFYDKVMKHKVELTDSFPDKFKEYRLAPQIRKDSIERLKGKDFSGLMADAKESYKIFEDEEKRGSNLRLIDEEGNLVNFIPIYFSNKIKDINNLTDDVASSMIAFVNMGINRRALTGILDSLELSREVIKARGILRVDSLGRPIKGKKKFAGKEEIEEQINIEKGAGRVYEMLNQFLLDTVYGQKDVPLGEVMGVDVARLIDTLSMHTALVQLGVNIYAGIANVNVAKAMIRIEAASGQFFSFRDVLYADQIYAKELPKTLGDIGQRKFNSKVTLWLEKHDTLENYNEEIAGLDLERKTMFSRLFNKSALFFLSRSGEHYIHGRGSIALSNQFRFDKSTNRFVHKSKFYSELRDLEFKKKEEINNLGDKLKQLKKEGKLKDTIKSINDKYSPIIESKKKELDAEWDKMTNYWDAHEVVNNRLVLKDEFKGSNWQQDHLDYTNMQHAINQELHGNYGPYGAALQRYAWGRAIMMFHKWLKPYWDRRYKRLRYDHRKQSDVEGYYTTVFNFAMQLAKDMRDGQYSLLKNWSALTTQEKANFNRAFTEVAYVLSLAVLSAAIMSIREGGDDDSWAINMTAYQLNRLITEVGVMTPSPLMFSESLRLIQSPAASVHMVDDLFKVFDVTSWFKEIERGRYKDMYGIQRNIIKVTPILKQSFDYSYPEEKLVFYNSSK